MKEDTMTDIEVELSDESRDLAMEYALKNFLTEKGRARLENIPKLFMDSGFEEGLIAMAIAEAVINTVELEKVRREAERSVKVIKNARKKKGLKKSKE